LETGNDIKNEGVLFLLECFKNNTSLILLTFEEKNIAERVASSLEEKLKNNRRRESILE